MKYESQARAQEVAAMLNARKGYPKARVAWRGYWTVICSYLPVRGEVA